MIPKDPHPSWICSCAPRNGYLQVRLVCENSQKLPNQRTCFTNFFMKPGVIDRCITMGDEIA